MYTTAWNIQRESQDWVEKRRGREEIEVTWWRKRRVKRRETGLASNSSLSVLHSLEYPKRFTELGREEKGEGGDRGDLVEKKESPKWETAVKPVISLPSKNGY